MDRRSTKGYGVGRTRRAATGLLLLGGALLLGAGAAGAQERSETEECRCVDADGNEIENCTCIVRPDVEAFSQVFTIGPANRARIGVTVSGQQHARWDRDGAHVESVLEGGPADEAGLREGDVIVRVNGHSLFDPLDDQEDEDDLDLDQSVPVQRLLALLGDVEPGDEVEIEYLRDGETRRAVLEAEENPAGFGRGLAVLDQVGPGIVWNRGGDVRAFSFPEEGRAWRFNLPEGRLDFDFPEGMRYLRMDTLRYEGGELGELLAGSRDPCFTRGSGASSGGSVWIFGGNCVDGLELTEVNPELGEYFGTDEGLLVTEVREGSTLGLRAGDVLLAVDGREVEDVGHARRILQSYRPDEELTLRIMRSGEAMEVTGRRR